jgi:type IV pilus assembly protein PilX
MNRMEIRSNCKTQRGAALFVSLLLLVIMTLLALAAGQGTRMQEKMSGNARDADLAFQASEAALRDGEQMIVNQTAQPLACASPPCNFFQLNVLPDDLSSQNNSWWGLTGRQYQATDAGTTSTKVMTNVAEDPRSVIEELGYIPPSTTIGRGAPPPGRTFYRVTAHGTGGTTAAQAVVESTYSRAF